MAEAIGVAGSIVGIKLATGFEINSTAVVLSQLQGVIKKDCDAAVPIFNIDGVRDIKRLSDRCKRIYGVIILLNEAAEGSENKKAETSVKLDLFPHIQVVNLAQFQIHHPTRDPGSLEEEQALRELAQELMRKRANHAKQIMQRRSEKADKALPAAPTTKPESVAPPPGETISGIKQPEAPPLLAITTHDVESGKQTEDGLDKPAVNPSPQPDGMEATMESNRPQPQDGNMVENAVHPLANGFQRREVPSISLPPRFFYRPPDAASDVVTEDESGGDYSPSTSNQEDGGSHDNDGGSIRGSTGAPTDTTSSNLILRFIPNWAHGIFSRGRHDDRESDRLEGFLLELPARADLESKPSLMKIEMEQKHIDAALSAIVPRRWHRGRPQMWEQYKALYPRVRHEIHFAITLAKQWNNQSRTWIATEFMQQSELDQQDSVHVVLFFRLGEEVEPVTLNTSSGNFTLPYEQCRTWEMMESILVKVFTKDLITDEIDTSKLNLGELLRRWINVPDSGGNSVFSPESDTRGTSKMRID
ncbi:hypothetical protein NCS56_00936700 [Fusarium sp. Ph1]|nr:hypothetical protein NCS56_00936700 [Fusarium sp. Ph1]